MINCSNIQKEDACINKLMGVQQSLNLIYYVTESCWIFEIYFLFSIFVTLYKKIRKSQEILGNEDSANPRSWVNP